MPPDRMGDVARRLEVLMKLANRLANDPTLLAPSEFALVVSDVVRAAAVDIEVARRQGRTL